MLQQETRCEVADNSGAKIAYVNIQYIAANSADGKAANAKVEALVKKKQAEVTASQKTPQDAQRVQQQAQAAARIVLKFNG